MTMRVNTAVTSTINPQGRMPTLTRSAQLKAAIVDILSQQGGESITVYELHRRLLTLDEDCPALSTVYRHIRRLESSGRLVVDATRIGGRPMLGYRLAPESRPPAPRGAGVGGRPVRGSPGTRK